MVELFKAISEERKRALSLSIDISFYKADPKLIAQKILRIRRDEAKTEEEKQFVDFYFNLTLIKMKEIVENEDYSDQW